MTCWSSPADARSTTATSSRTSTAAQGNEYISFTSKPEIVRLNQAIGEVDDDQYKRLQIRKTIETHLDKELLLRPQGIKVLSLFFIDRVANYREYDERGQPAAGQVRADVRGGVRRGDQESRSTTASSRRSTGRPPSRVSTTATSPPTRRRSAGRAVTLFKESSGRGNDRRRRGCLQH